MFIINEERVEACRAGFFSAKAFFDALNQKRPIQYVKRIENDNLKMGLKSMGEEGFADDVLQVRKNDVEGNYTIGVKDFLFFAGLDGEENQLMTRTAVIHFLLSKGILVEIKWGTMAGGVCFWFNHMVLIQYLLQRRNSHKLVFEVLVPSQKQREKIFIKGELDVGVARTLSRYLQNANPAPTNFEQTEKLLRDFFTAGE